MTRIEKEIWLMLYAGFENVTVNNMTEEELEWWVETAKHLLKAPNADKKSLTKRLKDFKPSKLDSAFCARVFATLATSPRKLVRKASMF